MAQLLASNQEYVLIVRGSEDPACVFVLVTWRLSRIQRFRGHTTPRCVAQDVRPKDECQYMLPKGEGPHLWQQAPAAAQAAPRSDAA